MPDQKLGKGRRTGKRHAKLKAKRALYKSQGLPWPPTGPIQPEPQPQAPTGLSGQAPQPGQIANQAVTGELQTASGAGGGIFSDPAFAASDARLVSRLMSLGGVVSEAEAKAVMKKAYVMAATASRGVTDERGMVVKNPDPRGFAACMNVITTIARLEQTERRMDQTDRHVKLKTPHLHLHVKQPVSTEHHRAAALGAVVAELRKRGIIPTIDRAIGDSQRDAGEPGNSGPDAG